MNDVIEWLFEPNEPSIRYRMLTEYFGKPLDDMEVIAAKKAVLESKNVKRIFSRLDENGLFPHKPEYYGNFTTFNYLYALSELGLTIKDEGIAHIVDWILTRGNDKHEHFIQKEFQNEHAYLLDESNIGGCRQVHFLSTLVRLGALGDERVKRIVTAFIEKSRFDGGYLCKWKKSRHAGQEPKSCYIATVPALLLYAYLPGEYRNNSSYNHLIDYFTSRNMIYSKVEPNKIIADTRLFIHSVGLSQILTILYTMSYLGHGNIPEMSAVWEIVNSKKTVDGKYLLEYSETKRAILMDKTGKPNKWVTFYIEMAKRQKNDFVEAHPFCYHTYHIYHNDRCDICDSTLYLLLQIYAIICFTVMANPITTLPFAPSRRTSYRRRNSPTKVLLFICR